MRGPATNPHTLSFIPFRIKSVCHRPRAGHPTVPIQWAGHPRVPTVSTVGYVMTSLRDLGQHRISTGCPSFHSG
jgi:hypothetical protein